MLTIKNLSKEYISKKKIKKLALNNINITFQDKGLYFITGQTGCGKTTLLNMIGKLDIPTSGEIIYQNTDITKYSNQENDIYRNNEIGFVFQEYNLIDDLQVIDNLKIIYELKGKQVDEEKIEELLDYFKISECKNKLCEELSGGERQRVALIRAILKDSKIILADEPTGAVDKKTGELIISYLKEISKERLVIVVTHNEEYARTYGDAIIKMEDGMIISQEKGVEEQKEEKENNIAPIKNIRLSTTIKLASHYLKANIKYLLALLLITTITFTFVGVLLSYITLDENEMATRYLKENDRTYLQVGTADKLNPSRAYGISNINNKELLSEKQLQEYQTKLKCPLYPVYFYRTIVVENQKFYLTELDDYFDNNNTNQNKHEFNYYVNGIIECSDSLKTKFNLLGNGKFPENDNEIAVTDYYYKMFEVYGYYDKESGIKKEINSYDDLLGLKINLYNYEMEICGIIDSQVDCEKTINDINKILDTTSNEAKLLNRRLNYEYKTGIIGKLFVNDHFAKEKIKPFATIQKARSLDLYLEGLSAREQGVHIESYLLYNDSLKDKIIWVNDEQSKNGLKGNEIIVSSPNLLDVYIDEETNISGLCYEQKQIIKENHPNIEEDELYTLALKEVLKTIPKDYLIQYDKTLPIILTPVKIVGVYVPNGYPLADVILSSDLYTTFNEQQNVNDYFGFIVPLDNSFKNIIQTVKKVNSLDGVVALDYESANLAKIRKTSEVLIEISTILCAIVIFSIAVLYFGYSSTIIKIKHNDMGILKSLGIKKGSIFKIFLCLNLVIIALSFILSIIGIILTIPIVEDILLSKFVFETDVLAFRGVVVLILIIISLVILLLSSYIPSIKLESKKIVELLRENEF